MRSKKRNKGLDIDGIFLLDKSAGESSNRALQKVKRLLNANKAGHTGSLDPLATGLLPICLGSATKFSQFLLDADKKYRVTAKLGVTTATGDSEGEVTSRRPLDSAAVAANSQSVFDQFTGAIEQIPSMYSALKHNGEPLYKLARQGIEVERKPRLIHIYQIQLLAQGEDYFEVEVHCSKGTYIRSLIEDMGEVLGCGAHVAQLTRLASGPFSLQSAHTVDELESLIASGSAKLDQLLLPVSSMVVAWPKAVIGDHSAYYLKQGQAISCPKIVETSEHPVSNVYQQGVQIWQQSDDGQCLFLGVGEITESAQLAPRKLVGLNTPSMVMPLRDENSR